MSYLIEVNKQALKKTNIEPSYYTSNLYHSGFSFLLNRIQMDYIASICLCLRVLLISLLMARRIQQVTRITLQSTIRDAHLLIHSTDTSLSNCKSQQLPRPWCVRGQRAPFLQIVFSVV